MNNIIRTPWYQIGSSPDVVIALSPTPLRSDQSRSHKHNQTSYTARCFHVAHRRTMQQICIRVRSFSFVHSRSFLPFLSLSLSLSPLCIVLAFLSLSRSFIHLRARVYTRTHSEGTTNTCMYNGEASSWRAIKKQFSAPPRERGAFAAHRARHDKAPSPRCARNLNYVVLKLYPRRRVDNVCTASGTMRRCARRLLDVFDRADRRILTSRIATFGEADDSLAFDQ